MKNSARYAKKVKRLLGKLESVEPAENADPLRVMVGAVLEEDATTKQAAEGLSKIEDEFVDFNELRVSPHKDIVESLGRDYPGARAKAEALTRALNAIFDRTNTLSLDYLADKPKREIRKALREQVGLSPYAESVLTLSVFDGHAVPVDNLLLEALKLDKCIDPDSDLADLQGFLERIILNKDALAAHEALRGYASKSAGRVAKELARRARRAEAAAKAAARKAASKAKKRPARAKKKVARKRSTRTTKASKPRPKRARKKTSTRRAGK